MRKKYSDDLLLEIKEMFLKNKNFNETLNNGAFYFEEIWEALEEILFTFDIPIKEKEKIMRSEEELMEEIKTTIINFLTKKIGQC